MVRTQTPVWGSCCRPNDGAQPVSVCQRLFIKSQLQRASCLTRTWTSIASTRVSMLFRRHKLNLTCAATVPGLRPRPGFERSITSPEFPVRRPPSDSNDQTPRASVFPGLVSSSHFSPSISDQTPRGSVRRVSSMMLAQELKPLTIPTKKSMQFGYRTEYHVPTKDPEDILPPQVPPKSPRTESRASPRTNTGSHTISSSISTLHSKKSTSQFTTSSKCSSQTDHSSETNNITPQTPATKSPGTPFSKFNKYSVTRHHSPQIQRKGSEDDPRSLWSKLRPPTNPDRLRLHSRGMSDTSTYDSGRRPSVKTTGIRKIRDLVLGTTPLEPRYPSMPQGFRSVEAAGSFSDAESCTIRRQAQKQAEGYEILKLSDLGALTQVRSLISKGNVLILTML